MTLATEQRWVRLYVGPKHKRLSPVWHRADGEQTACGFLLSDRAAHAAPPPGAQKCRNCEKEWVTA